MTEKHSIATPSEGLVLQWSDEWYKAKVKHMTREKYMCMQAAQWGANKELEACCEWISMHTTWDANRLHTARRSKSPSLKDEVKQIIDCLVEGDCLNDGDAIILRRALEQLND